MKDEVIKTILVELDCLLDTRIATVAKLNPEAAVKLLGDHYYNRTMDDFEELTEGLVTNEEYKKAYRERDKEILKNSRLTGIIKILIDLADVYDKAKIEIPYINKFIVGINVYPYQMTEDEKKELSLLIKHYCGIVTEVRVVSVPLENLTPKYLSENWDGFIIYEFDEWFKVHVDALDKKPIPRISAITPALYIKKPTKPEDVMVAGHSAFEVIELSFTIKLALEYINVKEFCIIKL